MPDACHRYVSDEEDSGRWDDFPFRAGDIIVSTRSKSGTTWMQMICALLVFGAPELPDRLGRLSPWLDHLVAPRDEVVARLRAQQHRRVIKTHTPLDGLPLDPRARYIVVGRHPLDMAVSLYHQGDNIDRERLRELTGAPETAAPQPPKTGVHEWLLTWIASRDDPREVMDSLPGVMWHLSDAWARRAEPNVLMIHYADLSADLGAEMRRIATWLGVVVDEAAWPSLVSAASFEHMRANAAQLAPAAGMLKDQAAFFRRGKSGAGSELLDSRELADYHARAAELAAPPLLAWLHR
jgi:aryl sulfotransferase